MNRRDNEAFFKTGGTLPADAPSYLARDADTKLLETLSSGEFCYLLNSRQMGKSSLCVRAVQELQRRGVRTAYLELSEIGGANVEAAAWYATLLNRIGREIGLHREFAQYRRERADLTPVSSLFSALEEIALIRIAEPIVIILDEIDTMRSLPFPADEFFSALRGLYNRRVVQPDLRRLTFCLVGSATPADLVSDTRLSPFNIGERIDLRDFTSAEAAPLADGLRGEGRDCLALLDRVYYWTNGHPFLTQSVCARIADEPTVRTASDVDALVAEMFFSASALRGNVHLADVANRMLTRKTGEIDPADDSQKAAILALYEQIWRSRPRIPDDETNPLVSLLKLSGVVRVEGGALRIRNRIYERVFGKDWIAESRPDAETRRQKVAAAKGRRQVGSIALAVISTMGFLLWRTVQAEISARRETEYAQHLLYMNNINNAQREMSNNNYHRARELLKEAGTFHGKNFEWNYLTTHLNDERFAIPKRPVRKQIVEKNGKDWKWQFVPNEFEEMGQVNTLAYSPDGKTIAVAAASSQYGLPVGLDFFDAETGKYIRSLPYQGSIDTDKGFAFSPDGKHIAVIQESGFKVDVIELTTGQEKFQWMFPETTDGFKDPAYGAGLKSIAFTSDGKHLICVGAARTQTVSDGGRKQSFTDSGTVSILNLSPEKQNELKLIRNPTADFVSDTKAFFPKHCLAVSPDGKKMVTCDVGSQISFWDIQGGELRRLKNINSGYWGSNPNSASWSPDDRYVAIGELGRITLWNARSFEQVNTLKMHSKNFVFLAFSPDSKRLAASDDSMACLWDIERGKIVQEIKGHESKITALAFSPDGKSLLTGTSNDGAKIWDIDFKNGITLIKVQANIFAFSADSKRLVTIDEQDSVRIWNSVTGQPLPFSAFPETLVVPLQHSYRQIALSKNGVRFARIRGNAAIVKDPRTGKIIQSVTIPNQTFTSAMFSADGNQMYLLARSDNESDVLTHSYILNFQTGETRPSTEKPSGLYTFRAGSRVYEHPANPSDIPGFTASFDGRRAFVPDFREGVEVVETNSHRSLFTLPEAPTTIGVFSIDGNRLATAPSEKSLEQNVIKIWDANLGRELLTLENPNLIDFLSFSPDGESLAALSWEGVRIYHSLGMNQFWRQNEEARQIAVARKRNLQDAWLSEDWSRFFAVVSEWSKNAPYEIDVEELQAEALLLQGRNDEALKAWKRLCGEVSADKQRNLNALLFQINSDGNSYRELCRLSLPKDVTNFNQWNDLAWDFCLGPNATDDYSVIVSGMEKTVRTTPIYNTLNTMGALYYRAGRYNDAIIQLKKSDGMQQDAMNWIFLAMASERLGRHEAATEWLQKARIYLSNHLGEDNTSSHLEYLVLYREANTLIKGVGMAPKTSVGSKGK